MDLQKLTDQELQKEWNNLALFFDGKHWPLNTERPRAAVVGFFSLSRETERRGLKLEKNLFEEIILKPKNANQ